MKTVSIVIGLVAASLVASAVIVDSTQGTAQQGVERKPVAASPMGPVRHLTAEGTGFAIGYHEPKDPTHRAIKTLLAEDRVFERIVASLDRALRMKGPIAIEFGECSAPNAFFDPGGPRIVMCYELVSYFLTVFRPHAADAAEVGAATIGAVVFAFFHELGHALIHHLELPVTGREEDAADQVATLILLEAGDAGVAMALSGARWFGLLAKDDAQRTPFWDEHGLDGQRFYNVICMVYGAVPSERAALVGEYLPESRAKRCAVEFAKLEAAWQKLLAPHLRA